MGISTPSSSLIWRAGHISVVYTPSTTFFMYTTTFHYISSRDLPAASCSPT